jgi:NSS family neurotransmitter:Na+ symporter
MHEIGTAFFTEELHRPRKQSAWILTIICSLLAIGCSLSLGAVDGIKLFGKPLLDFCDFITAQIMLPLGAFLTSLFAGWFVNQQLLKQEFLTGIRHNNNVSTAIFHAYQFSVRFIVPLCILLIFLHQFGIL